MTFIDSLASLPPFALLKRRRFEREFARHAYEAASGSLYRGIYDSFDAAQASAPPGKPLGYDNPAAADLYFERTRRVYPSDYPVMFWLDRLLRDGAGSVFDFGGHIGIGYYAYRKYLTYPSNLRWTVHDVPAVMARGRELAQSMGPERRLSFAASVAESDGYDVFFAAGSLQYLKPSLSEMLTPLARKPRHLLLNLMPLHATESFFTLQSIGAAFCPYRITQFGEFVRSLTQLGYVQRDGWENPDKRCMIAFEPARSLDRYYGFLFELSR